jgi:hypothetical protein
MHHTLQGGDVKRWQNEAARNALVEVELDDEVKQGDNRALRIEKADGEIEDEHNRIDAVRQKLLERFASVLGQQHNRQQLEKCWRGLVCFDHVTGRFCRVALGLVPDRKCYSFSVREAVVARTSFAV